MNKLGEGDGVQKSLLKLLLAMVALLVSASANALGTGGINVTSALGQPLKAEIELVAVGREERNSLEAQLAMPTDYAAAGLEYPHNNKIKFKLEAKSNGDLFLSVTSEKPINDPFVSLLVELNWSSGKLLREYTFLLDPPGYEPEPLAQAELHVVAPAAQVVSTDAFTEPLDAEQATEEQAMPVEPPSMAMGDAEMSGNASAVVDTSTQAMMEEQERAARAKKTARQTEQQLAPVPTRTPVPAVEPSYDVPERLKVRRGNTMYKLADQYRAADVSVERMLVAMYRANANEFGGRNMNRIRAGKILRMPSEQELAKVTQSDAEREIRVQTADWNAYRQKLAGAVSVSRSKPDTQQVAVGKINSSVIDQAPVAKETAKEVLRLSKGEAPGDQATAGAGGKGMTAQDKQNAAQEEAIAKAKALDEERMRKAMLEQNLRDAQLLAQMKAELAAKSAAAAAPAPTPQPEPVPAVAAEKKVKVEAPIKPPVKPAVAPPPVPAPEPSLVDQIMEDPIYLAGGLGVVLALAGLGYAVVRRKKKSSVTEGGVFAGESEEDVGEITGRLAQPEVSSPDTGDFTKTVITTSTAAAAASAHAEQEPESVDPISEADLFLSFGRDGQAEEILKDALQNNPSNHQIHLKLLGIYSSRQDADSFSAIASQLKDSGDEYAWEQAVEMGRKLDPGNPMYGGTGSMEDTISATMQMPAFNIGEATAGSAPAQKTSALDMDFDLNPSADTGASSPEQNFLDDMETTAVLSSSHEKEEQQPVSMDFDITSSLSSASGEVPSDTAESGNLSSSDMDTSMSMDFDITSSHSAAGGQEAESVESEGMVFDVTGSHAAATEESASSTPDSDLGMAFTMDFPTEKEPVKAAPEPFSADLSGINLNFDDEPGSNASAGGGTSGGDDSQWEDVATKLDLAKAYQEMGDVSGAREILEEVLLEGNDEQRQAAQTLLDQLY